MERSEYYKTLSGDIKCRYEEKLKVIDGVDPYLLRDSDCGDFNSLPGILMIDLVNYLILTHSFYTGQQLKAYKSLQAYKFYEAGLVQKVYGKRINANAYAVVGKVKHSQRLKEKPLDVWIIILSDSSVSSAHCVCMAGLGEVCSHIAAVLFYLNSVPKLSNEASTSKLAVWPVPPVKNAEMCKIKDMNWTKIVKTKARDNVSEMKEERGILLEKFYKIGVTSAAARLLDPVAQFLEENMVTNIPLSLDNVFKCDYVGKEYEEILQIANKIKIKISIEEMIKVEEATREQSLSTVWLEQRVGRITASKFKLVCRTSLEKPSLSLIKGICYPQKMIFTSKQTQYGIKHEKDAINAYSDMEKQKHVNFVIKKTGFYICNEHPELGASPDALFECSCCGKGCVEVKCPYLLKNMSLIEFAKKNSTCLKMVGDDMFLDRNHAYFYQVQMQMFVTKTKICHFVIWSKNTLFMEKIVFDEAFIKQYLGIALNFFKLVIKPEFLGKYFTSSAGIAKVSLWCTCKTVDDGKQMMIKCDNDDCKIGWFHFSCAGLREFPEDYWFCKDCI